MFRNKVVVRSAPPFSPSASPFLLLQIHIDLPIPSPSTKSISSPPFLKIESLCWKLSRTLHLACFHQFPCTVLVVYKRNQLESARKAVDVLVQNVSVSHVGEEEELSSGTMVAKVVECGLKSVLLNSGWRCTGESCFVHSSFSSSDERRHLMAFNVGVQSEVDDDFVFLVSPDVLRFSRYKITDLVGSKMRQRFESGEDIVLEDYSFTTSCFSLPSLHEGHVRGLRKLLPSGEDLLESEEVWSFKHGLEAESDYFINIQFTGGSLANTKWFPSAFVLQGAGFSPAPQSVRISESVRALQCFIRTLGSWDFFGRGMLKVKGIFSLTIGLELPTWTETASGIQHHMTCDKNESISENVAVLNKLLSAHDFRAPKLASGCNVRGRDLDYANSKSSLSSSNIAVEVSNTCFHGSSSTDLNVKQRPFFVHRGPVKENSHSGDSIVQGHLPSFSRRKTNHKNGNLKKPQVVSEVIATEGATQMNVEIYTKDVYLPSVNSALVMNGTKSPMISGSSKGSGKSDVLDTGCLMVTGKEAKMDAAEKVEVNMDTRKRSSMKEKSKDDMLHKITKRKMKLQKDASSLDTTKKVIDCHARGQLESLTVAELKCFLVSKQAKVGGKKQDLIERVNSLLV